MQAGKNVLRAGARSSHPTQKSIRRNRFIAFAAVAALAGLASHAHAVAIDGSLNLAGDEGYGSALKLQTNPTQFGNNTDASGLTAGGSELDAVYGVVANGNLNLLFTGNLETNFNHLNVFIDDGSGLGQNVLSASGSLSSMSGSKFSSDFKASYAIDINGGGNPLTFYLNTNKLLATNNGPSSFEGSFNPTVTGTPFTVGHETLSINNSNTIGVDGGAVNDPSAVTTGIEMAIPLSVLGNPTSGTLKILADINGGGNSFLSNQFLPGLPPASGNIGNGGKFDFSATTGFYFSIAVPTPPTIVWASTTGGSWNTPGNWVGGVIPNFASASATLGSNLAASGTLSLNGNKTVGKLIFNNSTASYTIAPGSPSTSSLTIDDTGDTNGVTPTIQVITGNHFITAPVVIGGSAGLTFSVQPGSNLSLSGGLSGTGPVTITDSGNVIFAVANSYSGNTNIQDGSLEVRNNASASTSTINLGQPTAELVPATLSLGAAGLNITNNIVTIRDGSGNDSQRLIAAGPSFTSGAATVSGSITINGGLAFQSPAGVTITASGVLSDGTDASGVAKHSVLINNQTSPTAAINTGTVVLSNANTYSGLTAVDAGTLVLANNTAAGSGQIFIGNGGASFADANATLSANTAGLNIANTISTNQADNGTTVGLGTRTIGGTADVTYSGNIFLNGGANLSAGAGSTVTFSSVIADGTNGGNVSHAVTVSGPGTVVLSNIETYSGNTTVNASGVLSVTGALTSGNNLTSNGSTTFAANTGSGILPITLGNLTIGAAGSVKLNSPAAQANRSVLLANGLTFVGPVGTLDLGTNDLIIHNASASDVYNAIKTGFNKGAQNGTAGILSSPAAHSTLVTLGVIQNDMPSAPGTPVYSTFDNQSGLSSTDVIVKYTYFGDADLSGNVTSNDYTLIDAGFNSHGSLTGWSNGDFNYDGKVDGSDYSLIDNAFNRQGASLAAAPSAMVASASSEVAAAVPEPGSLSLLALGAWGLSARRRRK